MKKGTIYKITTKHNGLVYVGQTVQSLRRRWRSHLSHFYLNTHHNELLQKVFDKYGEDDFVVEVLDTCDVSELDEKERYWISYYDATNREKGYNFESGGNKLKKHSENTVQKMKISQRGKNNLLVPEQVTEIKKSIIAGDSLTDIANRFHVTGGCIYRIKILQNWAWVSSELNEEVFNTNTGRKVKCLTDEEINDCRKRILNGESAFNLSNEYNVPYRRFFDTFKNEIDESRNKKRSKKEIVQPLAMQLFFENRSVEEILDKTGLNYVQYKKMIKGLEPIRRERNIEYTVKAKAEGKTNSVIAKELNVNRCTISVYLNEYRQKYADTVIS